MLVANVLSKSSISADTGNHVIKSSLKDSTNNLKMAYFNARSLNMDSKFTELLRLIDGVDFHFIVITETWFKPWMSSNSVFIPGFALIRNDRSTHAGGVAIYIREDLKWKILDSSTNGPIEYLFIEVLVSSSRFLVGVVYNSQGGNVDYIQDLLATYTSTYDHILIAGDFNINMLKFDSVASKLKNVLLSQNLAYLPTDQPTHFNDFHGSASLIDMVIVSDVSMIQKFVQLDLSIFDHDFIYLSYQLPIPPVLVSSFSYRSYKDVSYDSLYTDCVNLNWGLLYNCDLVDDKVSIFSDYLRFLFDKHVPLKKFVKGKRTTPIWFNKSIQLAISNRETLYRTWRGNKSDVSRNNFLQSRRAVKKLTRIAKSNYIYRQLDPKLASRKLWRNVRNLGLSKDVPPTPQFLASELNSFFVNSGSVNATPLSSYVSNSSAHVNRTFNFELVDEATVQSAIRCIKSNAIGDDGIPLQFIKLILPSIIPFLCHIINVSIRDSVFPSQWKISKVIPIPKGPSAKTISDMRPISVLPVLSKVLEIIMKNQITHYLNLNKYLISLQSGFRAKHSTATAMLKISDDITSMLDNKQVVLLVLLDFSKAFDTLRHDILLSKLKCLFNFSDQAVEMVHIYLTGRTQYVKFNDDFSCPLANVRGVPQGSVLGPLLFLMFINDVASIISHCKYHLYADDLQVYLSSPPTSVNRLALQINEDLQSISNWAQSNGLCLNSTKSKVLKIYRGNVNIPNPRIEINTEIIAYASSAQNLGFIITSDFEWDKQVNRVCGNIYAGLKRLSKFSSSTPFKTKKTLAHSLLISQIIYSDLVLGKLDYGSKRRLQVAFNSITRYVYNLSRFEHITPYSKSLLGCTLINYLKYRQCVFLFNVIRGNCPYYLRDKIKTAQSTRCVTLIIPKHSTSFRSRSFFINGAQTWNSLPLHLKQISHLHQFKGKCMNYFCTF